jgi:hypothetical protein
MTNQNKNLARSYESYYRARTDVTTIRSNNID